eukprot:Tbor_TRINITY_DN5176_c5_g3::TRINITY_DN5176_c5_g3_i1::g.25887::m.25887/K03246/EIF3I; translation initiation factor 3 subunit I
MKGISIAHHMMPVTQVKWNDDGDLLFSASKEPGVCVWRSSNGHLLGRYDTEKGTSALDINHNSTILATASFDLYSELWCVRSGARLARLEQLAPCKAIGISHDDSMLFVACENKMRQKSALYLYYLPSDIGCNNNIIKTRFDPFQSYKEEDSEESITSAVWGGNNKYIYFGTKTGVVVKYDVEAGKTVSESFVHNAQVNQLHFDSNYLTLVSASADKTACLIDPRVAKGFRRYEDSTPVNDASISPITDHVLLGGGTDAQDVTTTQSGSGRFEVKFYHKVHEDFLGAVKCHFGTINAVQYSPSGKGFASGAVDGMIKIYNNMPQTYYNSPGGKVCWDVPEYWKYDGDGDLEEEEEGCSDESDDNNNNNNNEDEEDNYYDDDGE